MLRRKVPRLHLGTGNMHRHVPNLITVHPYVCALSVYELYLNRHVTAGEVQVPRGSLTTEGKGRDSR